MDRIPSEWRDAVAHRGAPLVVLGVAGTGKTRLIVERFLSLAGDGGGPERIAVCAASPARATALRAQIESALARGYERLCVGAPADFAQLLLGPDAASSLLGAGDRVAMLLERVGELSLQHHDFGGSASALLGRFVRRIDGLKAELIGTVQFDAWTARLTDVRTAAREREFADVYRAHERMLKELGARDPGDLITDALKLARSRPPCFDHVLVDDAHGFGSAAAGLLGAIAAGGTLTVTGDPLVAAVRLDAFVRTPGTRVIRLERSLRCPEPVIRAARIIAGGRERLAAGGGIAPGGGEPTGAPRAEISFWRCPNRRAQAQSVAAEIEQLIARDGVAPGEIAVLVPSVIDEGQAVAVALEERGVAHRLIGEAAFFQRAEIRDVLAWLRLLADPTDSAAVVRALARPPIQLRSVDIARCTQISRRRKLDMIAALAAATESPQVPPAARERIRVFLKLYRSGLSALDTTRPDLFVHRLIERLGLRRQQLFAAQADVVERLRALARFGELAAGYVRRTPQATAREFAQRVRAVAEFGLREQEEPELDGARVVQVVPLTVAAGLEVEHVYVLGMQSTIAVPEPDPLPDAPASGPLGALQSDGLSDAPACGPPSVPQPEALSGAPLSGPAAGVRGGSASLGALVYLALTRARTRAVISYVSAAERGSPLPTIEAARRALGAEWEDRQEELFGPGETLHSTYRLLRDELLDATVRAGGRLAELRLDTDLDVSHAVVRYLELLKVAALIARPEGQGLAEAVRDVNARILQAVTAEQKEIFTTSTLDDYLLDAERDVRRRAQAIAARDEPSLEPFLPLRGDGVVLSASDIDTYRTCPLKYKFARVFRIPQEPTIHQRFGIVVHQVLERFHARGTAPGTLGELLGLLDAGWRRAGFGDSEEERQLRGKAATALERYHSRFRSQESEPVWFERPFTFRLGPHLLRGRVDRVDRLPDGEYELIDYKTGRPKSEAQLADDVQLSLYAVGAREAWQLEASRQAYYYLLDDRKVSVAGDGEDRSEWVCEIAREVAEGIRSQGFEPTPSYAACSVCDYRLVCPAAER